MLHNLKSYKLSKILVKDLANILRIITEYENKMSVYKKYTPISKMLNNLKENKNIINYHFLKQKAILKSKGKVQEEPKLLEKK